MSPGGSLVSDRGHLPWPLSYTTNFIHLHRRVGGRKWREEWEVREGERREGEDYSEVQLYCRVCIKHPLGPLKVLAQG